MSKGRLKPEDEEIIQKNYKYLKCELEASDLLDSLYQNKVITLEDKIRIRSGRTKSDRNEDLLLTILHSGPRTSFSCFLLCLEEKYPHVREYLERKDGLIMNTVINTRETASLKIEVDKIETIFMEKNCEIQQLKIKCVKKDVMIENLREMLRKMTDERDDALSKLMEKCDDNKQLQTRLDNSESKLLTQPYLPEHPRNIHCKAHVYPKRNSKVYIYYAPCRFLKEFILSDKVRIRENKTGNESEKVN